MVWMCRDADGARVPSGVDRVSARATIVPAAAVAEAAAATDAEVAAEVETNADGTATWRDVSSTLTSATSLDPILFTDHRTNRTFVSQLYLACSAAARIASSVSP